MSHFLPHWGAVTTPPITWSKMVKNFQKWSNMVKHGQWPLVIECLMSMHVQKYGFSVKLVRGLGKDPWWFCLIEVVCIGLFQCFLVSIVDLGSLLFDTFATDQPTGHLRHILEPTHVKKIFQISAQHLLIYGGGHWWPADDGKWQRQWWQLFSFARGDYAEVSGTGVILIRGCS